MSSVDTVIKKREIKNILEKCLSIKNGKIIGLSKSANFIVNLVNEVEEKSQV